MNEENEVLVDPIDSVDVSEFTEDEATEAEETTEAEEVETTAEETTDTEQPEEGEAEKAAPTEEMFELKYNKEIRKVGREEMTTLAQKGMNYDKVLAQRDNFAREAGELRRTQAENEKVMANIRKAADKSGMDIPTFLSTLRENLLVADGMSREAAKERISREDAEEKLAEINKAKAEQAFQARAAEDRKRNDILSFQRKFPNVEAKDVPASVWEAVRNGESLVGAYGDYLRDQSAKENEKLQAKIKALEQNKKNKAASVGSVKSDGSGKADDPFLSVLLSD